MKLMALGFSFAVLMCIDFLRDGKWGKMHICIESKSLVLYDRSPTSEQSAMRIPVSSIKTIVDDVDATSILTLTSSYDGEANCVLKVINLFSGETIFFFVLKKYVVL